MSYIKSKIRFNARSAVVLVMLFFSWAITIGPNTSPVTGASKYILETFGVTPYGLAIATTIGALAILLLDLKKELFLLACTPITTYYAIVVVYAFNNHFNLGSSMLTALAYLYLLRASKD